MADAIESMQAVCISMILFILTNQLGGSTDLIGLGRAAVIEPSVSLCLCCALQHQLTPCQLPAAVLLNESIPDSEAIAMPHEVKGLWMARMVPVKAVGSGLPIQFFYYNSKLSKLLCRTSRLMFAQCGG